MRALAAVSTRPLAATSVPSSTLASDRSPLAPLKRKLEALLWQHRAALFTSQHRGGASFSLAGSFKVGGSCNVFFLDSVRKGDPRYLQHPTKNTGVYVVPPASQLAQGKVTPLQWQVRHDCMQYAHTQPRHNELIASLSSTAWYLHRFTSRQSS